MQHSQAYVLIFILQIAILICTMGLWTFGAGYLILFEKESDDPERDIKGEWDTRSIRDKGTMAGLAGPIRRNGLLRSATHKARRAITHGEAKGHPRRSPAPCGQITASG